MPKDSNFVLIKLPFMKIICVGMNYSRHNKELGETLLKPESPVIFMTGPVG